MMRGCRSDIAMGSLQWRAAGSHRLANPVVGECHDSQHSSKRLSPVEPRRGFSLPDLPMTKRGQTLRRAAASGSPAAGLQSWTRKNPAQFSQRILISGKAHRAVLIWGPSPSSCPICALAWSGPGVRKCATLERRRRTWKKIPDSKVFWLSP